MSVAGSTGRWHRLDVLFRRAAALPARGRSALIDGAEVDTALRRELERLLAADASSSRLLDRTLTAGSAPQLALPCLRRGQRVGSWRIRGLLGRGGMGIVYRVDQASDPDRAGALKLVCDGRCTPEGEARFADEYRALRLVRHPGIPRLLDVGKSAEGYCYLVTDLVAGIPITRWAKRLSLGAGARLRVVADACTVVAHLHDLGLAHLDLKPDNLLVDAEGRVHVLDFGTVRRFNAPGSAVPEWCALTARYAAPEQLAGRAPSPASDVYALGRVAAELLASAPTHRRREINPYLAIDRILRHAVHAAPERRYANARAFGVALRRTLQRMHEDHG